MVPDVRKSRCRGTDTVVHSGSLLLPSLPQGPQVHEEDGNESRTSSVGTCGSFTAKDPVRVQRPSKRKSVASTLVPPRPIGVVTLKTTFLPLEKTSVSCIPKEHNPSRC